MIFIYDIWINLNDIFYDFYEWDENDFTEHVRKIPLFRINSSMMEMLIKKNILINKSFLMSIYNKCEIFNNRSVELFEYCATFSDINRVIIVSFNKEGKVLELSSLSLSEEIEILDISETLTTKDIKYEKLENNYERCTLTRRENFIINKIIKELEKIKDDKEKLKYLCFEWFGNNDEASFEKLAEAIKKDFNDKHLEFIELLKLVV